MTRLIVIADDFTGALDTGIQFKAKDTRVLVGSGSIPEMEKAAEHAQVLVVDSETRHMSPEEAGQTVFRIAQEAARLKIPYLFKKTDSALRGNPGSELAAALQASGRSRLHFVPAFPVMGRTTLHGIHRINGVPVAQSAFGKDPFNPVTCSYVPDIIRNQTDVPVSIRESGSPDREEQGIIVHDAENDGDLRRIAEMLDRKGELGLLAGCAGFASVLPDRIGIVPEKNREFRKGEGFFFLCGSLNPVTIRQIQYAEEKNFRVLALTNRQKLDPEWSSGGKDDQKLRSFFSKIPENAPVIVESFSDQDAVSFRDYAKGKGYSAEEVRVRIAEGLGKLLKALIDLGLRRTFMISGGDTLLSFMSAIGETELQPVCELKPGVVLSRIAYGGNTLQVISKSGGFGAPELLEELHQMLQ